MRKVATPTTHLAKLGATMKEIVLRIKDAAVEDFMALVRLCPSVEVVDVDEAAVPCESSISKMMDMARGQLFYWTFSDTSDAQETTRRNNIVKRVCGLMRGRK